MSFADDVREHCRVRYIEPARARGDRTVRIRAGDVHADLKYTSRYPLVCSALGTVAFEELCGVERVGVDGPLNGANTIFTFRII